MIKLFSLCGFLHPFEGSCCAKKGMHDGVNLGTECTLGLNRFSEVIEYKCVLFHNKVGCLWVYNILYKGRLSSDKLCMFLIHITVICLTFSTNSGIWNKYSIYMYCFFFYLHDLHLRGMGNHVNNLDNFVKSIQNN